MEDLGGAGHILLFQHFGNKRLYIGERGLLNTICVAAQAMDISITMEADFIPMKGAGFKQIWRDDGLLASENYADGWNCPTDLENATITVMSSLTAGDGLLNVKLFPISSAMHDDAKTNITGVGGNILEDAFMDNVTTENARNTSLLPLSSTSGSQTFTIPIGELKQGDFLGYDVDVFNALTGNVFFVVEGNVKNQHFSKESRWHMNPTILDISQIGGGYSVN